MWTSFFRAELGRRESERASSLTSARRTGGALSRHDADFASSLLQSASRSMLKHSACPQLYIAQTAFASEHLQSLPSSSVPSPAAREQPCTNLQLSRSLYWIAFSPRNTKEDTSIRVTRPFTTSALCRLTQSLRSVRCGVALVKRRFISGRNQ